MGVLKSASFALINALFKRDNALRPRQYLCGQPSIHLHHAINYFFIRLLVFSYKKTIYYRLIEKLVICEANQTDTLMLFPMLPIACERGGINCNATLGKSFTVFSNGFFVAGCCEARIDVAWPMVSIFITPPRILWVNNTINKT